MTRSDYCRVFNLGLIGYTEALHLQDSLVRERIAGNVPDTILLLQHPPTITIGASGGEENILTSRDILAQQGISIFHTDRGGNITWHGPGQLVGYPIFDLGSRGMTLHHYVWSLEKVIIDTLHEFSIPAHRDHKYPGVWVGQNKICSLGIRISRWVTKHGFALNASNDLKYLSYIRPCGIADRGVTSMSQQLGRRIAVEDVVSSLLEHLPRVFRINLREESIREVLGIM